jgi:hypothetical protein
MWQLCTLEEDMKIGIILILLLTVFTLLSGQSLTINGQVSETGTPIVLENAEISVDNVPDGTSSDTNGIYTITFDWIWNGPVTIHCVRAGYIPQTLTFFPENDTVTVNFALEPDIITNEIVGVVTTEETGGTLVPISGATITIQTSLAETVTDINGEYTLGFNWNWDSAVVVHCQAEGYNPQTYSFFPEEYTSQVDFQLIPEEQPQPITIEGFVTRAYPENDSPVAGAFLSFSDGVNPPVCQVRSSLNGYFSGSLVWNWYGPVYIECHYPGFNRFMMNYYPSATVNTLNFFMQALPPTFQPPQNLSGDISPNTVSLQWEAPINWPFEDSLAYRIYVKEANALHFNPVIETDDLDYLYTFSPNQSGQWSADIAVTAFHNEYESAMSNITHQEISLENENEQITLSPFDVSCYPNPFNPETSISLNLQKSGHVVVNIYNIRGEKVVILADRNLPIGKTILNWKGIDSSGKPVGSGIYLLRINSETGRGITQKLTLIK